DGTRSSVPPCFPDPGRANDIAWEEPMVGATEYWAMAAEHHRLAGMCRTPASREQHLRLEQKLLALAKDEEWLHGSRAPAGVARAAAIQIATAPILDFPRVPASGSEPTLASL